MSREIVKAPPLPRVRPSARPIERITPVSTVWGWEFFWRQPDGTLKPYPEYGYPDLGTQRLSNVVARSPSGEFFSVGRELVGKPALYIYPYGSLQYADARGNVVRKSYDEI